MEITMISAVIVMAAYFLLLYGVVGFVQDKRFFAISPTSLRTCSNPMPLPLLSATLLG